MKLPRDLGGEELAQMLSRYGYRVVRQTGSHMRLVSSLSGSEHRITIPKHKPLRIGTLSHILKAVATYLDRDYQEFLAELFGDKP
ncbi:MAG TPA: type II toxin-antitoxin system HicA family toxin [Candidatus Acetothermia bacterium]|nr:type II toxin-antitoxin system HicA family toxin [Candidatus Acetothermia bacterium]